MASNLITEQLKNLPANPGVYLMKDSTGKIIYVGKALRLRDRVRSYFQAGADLDEKTTALVQEAQALDFFVTGSEQEALILENNFIKQYRPFYNIRLKDDKGYPYFRIDLKEDWPQVTYTRKVKTDGARYFGPFTNAWSVKHTLNTLEGIFGYRTCTKEITGTDKRACLKYFLKRCTAPCIGEITKEEYHDIIKEIILFLEGKQAAVVKALQEQMTRAAEALNFEGAARLRDRIQSIRNVVEGQKLAARVTGEEDVIAYAADRDNAFVQIYFIRESKLIGRENFTLTGVKAETPSSIMTSFVKQYYDNATYVPRLILLQHPIEDFEAIDAWLREKRQGAVEICVPLKGRRRELVNIVAKNAEQGMQQEKIKQFAMPGALEDALEEAQQVLNLPNPPQRVEGYDISNIQGKEAVGSMVVFEGGKPKPSHYRRFRIKTVEGANDFAMLHEVLKRRFKRTATPENGQSETWQIIPDLVLIDGGKGQLNAAQEALQETGAENIHLASLAKENEEIFLPGKSESILLPRNSAALRLLQRVRDEAHRFAITYHKNIHRKGVITSQLDSVPGVGPKRKKALLKEFGTVRGIKAASVEELLKVEGITKTTVEKIKEYLG